MKDQIVKYLDEYHNSDSVSGHKENIAEGIEFIMQMHLVNIKKVVSAMKDEAIKLHSGSIAHKKMSIVQSCTGILELIGETVTDEWIKRAEEIVSINFHDSSITERYTDIQVDASEYLGKKTLLVVGVINVKSGYQKGDQSHSGDGTLSGYEVESATFTGVMTVEDEDSEVIYKEVVEFKLI